MNGLAGRLAAGVVLGLLVVAGFGLLTDVDALIESLRGFPSPTLIIVIGCSLAGYAVRYIKWEVYLRCLSIQLPTTESALCFQAGMVMSISPGKVGEVLKSFLLRRSQGISVSLTAPIVLAERLTDLLALLMLASLGVAASGFGAEVLLAGLLLVLGVMAALLSERISSLLLSFIARFPRGDRLAESLGGALKSSRALLAPSPFGVTLLLSLIAWGFEAFGTYLVFEGLVVGALGLGESVFICSFSTVAGALSMLPGGMVATEGSMVALVDQLAGYPVSVEVAAAATLIVRFATLWLGVLLGAVALWAFYRLIPVRIAPTQ